MKSRNVQKLSHREGFSWEQRQRMREWLSREKDVLTPHELAKHGLSRNIAFYTVFSKELGILPRNATIFRRLKKFFGKAQWNEIIELARDHSANTSVFEIAREVLEGKTPPVHFPLAITPYEIDGLKSRYGDGSRAQIGEALDRQARVDHLAGKYADAFSRFYLAAEFHLTVSSRASALASLRDAFCSARPIAIRDYLLLVTQRIAEILTEKHILLPAHLISGLLREYAALDNDTGLAYGVQRIIPSAIRLLKSSKGVSAFDIESLDLERHRLFLERQDSHCKSLQREKGVSDKLREIAKAFEELEFPLGSASALHSAMIGALLRSDLQDLSDLVESNHQEIKPVFAKGSRWVFFSACGAKSHLHAHRGEHDEAAHWADIAWQGVMRHGLVPPLSYHDRRSFSFLLGSSPSRGECIPRHDVLPVGRAEIFRTVKLLGEASR